MVAMLKVQVSKNGLKANVIKYVSIQFIIKPHFIVGFFVYVVMGRFSDGSNRPIVSNWICSDGIIDVVFI